MPDRVVPLMQMWQDEVLCCNRGQAAGGSSHAPRQVRALPSQKPMQRPHAAAMQGPSVCSVHSTTPHFVRHQCNSAPSASRMLVLAYPRPIGTCLPAAAAARARHHSYACEASCVCLTSSCTGCGIAALLRCTTLRGLSHTWGPRQLLNRAVLHLWLPRSSRLQRCLLR